MKKTKYKTAKKVKEKQSKAQLYLSSRKGTLAVQEFECRIEKMYEQANNRFAKLLRKPGYREK